MATRMISLDVTDSTQDVARDACQGGPVLVVAGRQTRGRGRSGSEWETAPRALACSLALPTPWPMQRLPLLPAVAALAVADLWDDVWIKWPNDVLLDDRKLGGILSEASDGVTVIGFGANLWWPDTPEGVAARFDDDPGLAAAGAIASAWAEALQRRIDRGPDDWGVDEYRSRSWLVGREVTWEPSGSGLVRGIGDDGALEVVVDGEVRRLVSGAVRVVRPLDPPAP